MGVGAWARWHFPRRPLGETDAQSRAEVRPAAALTLVRHQCIGELVATHVSSGVGGLRCPQAGVGRAGMGGAGTVGAPAGEDMHPMPALAAWRALHSQREAEDVAADRRAVLAVVEQSQPKAVL